MKTTIYVDGFNLYYGALRGTRFKWLNPYLLCKHLLQSHHQITRIKYFTALVSERPTDLDKPKRQQTYLRALQTLPTVEIVYGQFLQSRIMMPAAQPHIVGANFVKVIKMEEKGSDVNIATHMVHDAHLGLYDAAILISNDSDLKEPVRIVRHDLGKVVGLLNPHKRPSFALQEQATFMKPIRKGVLKRSQFPNQLKDEKGTIKRPRSW